MLALWAAAEIVALTGAAYGLASLRSDRGRRLHGCLAALLCALAASAGLVYPVVAPAVQILRGIFTAQGPGWH